MTNIPAQLLQRMLVVVMLVVVFGLCGMDHGPCRGAPSPRCAATKKTPLLVQPGQGDGDPHLGITHQARQRHIWCIAAEIDDQVCLNTYFACLITTLPKKAG